MFTFFKLLFTFGLRSSLSAIYLSWIRNIDGAFGNALRYAYYKKRLKKLGKDVIIDTGVYLYGTQYISIDEGTHLDKGCILVGSTADLDLSTRILKEKKLLSSSVIKGEIQIGKHCHISQNAMIYGYYGVKIGDFCTLSAGSKIYSLTSIPYNPYNREEVVSIQPYHEKSPTLAGAVELEDNVWIGLDAVISPCVKIGKNSFVKSQTIIMTSFPENAYIGENPAKIIKKRYDY